MCVICNQHSSIKNLQIGDGEAAQLVKALPCKNKARPLPEFNPEYANKKLGMVTHTRGGKNRRNEP